MKLTDITDSSITIDKNNLDNFFNVYVNEYSNYLFNLNSTVYFSNIASIPMKFFSYYQCKDGETFMGISYKLYGTTHLWWMLMKLNNVTDAFAKIRTGNYIRYLTPSLVSNVLKEL